MRNKLRCGCHICKVERSLFASLNAPQGLERFSRLIPASPVIQGFTSPSALVAHLHAKQTGESPHSSAAKILGAILQTGSEIDDFELSQSLLVLAFTPTIHRTYWELRAWFRELEPEDIAQQVFALFLQLTASAPVEMLNHHIAFVLAQALHRNAVRWAKREQLNQLERERLLEPRTRPIEPIEDAHFESISLLREFLDYSVRIGILSEFERDLLIRVKVDGCVAKEVLERHTVLSPKAVHVRLQRIMKRLQDVAWEFPRANENSAQPLDSIEPKGTKIFHKV